MRPASASDYRPEIDGLRAISVGAVIAFHAGAEWFPGGYVGVDVFFVISGYLLTGIIGRDIASDRFSIGNFYSRRVRRILPALLGLIVTSAIAGVFILTPGDFEVFGRSALYTLAGSGNIFFYLYTGYFDPAATTMPLLHTWSLGVEEQFYVVWPALLWILARMTGKNPIILAAGCVAVAVASFVLNVVATHQNLLAAFYLPQNRGWELALGGCLTLIPRNTGSQLPRWVIEISAAAGLLVIAATVFLLKAQIAYPGFYGLLPVGGAMAFLWASDRPSLAGTLLATRPFRFFGKISYSLYLYHWPALVFYRHFNGNKPLSVWEMASLVGVTILVSWLSWRCIEQPARRGRAAMGRVLVTAGAAAAVVASICIAIVSMQGFPQRLPEPVRGLGSMEAMWTWDCPKMQTVGGSAGTCILGRDWTSAATKIALWGDSNAAQAMPIVAHAIGKLDVAAAFFGGCSPVVDPEVAIVGGNPDRNWARDCGEGRDKIIEVINRDDSISTILLVSSWASVAHSMVRNNDETPETAHSMTLFGQSLDALLDRIAKKGRTIVIVGEIPKFPLDPIPCVISELSSLLRKERCADDLGKMGMAFFQEYQAETQDILTQKCSGGRCIVVYPERGLCNAEACTVIINNEFIYRDPGHSRRNLKPETFVLLAEKMGLTELMRRVAAGPARQSADRNAQ